tara:strand:+ start:575 stop:1336 length:762 start_codon:yes stop_codon:yes gene_type:complete
MSLTGLQDGDFTSISVMYDIGLGQNADTGLDGQVIKSDGTDASWGNVDGSELFSAGAGITITDSAYPTKDIISANVDGTTISKTGGTGSVQLNTLKVPNALTQGTNITYSSGTTYDGSSAITISATDTDSTYTNGTGINLDGAQPDEEFSTNNEALKDRGTSNIFIGQSLAGLETQTITIGSGGGQAHTIALKSSVGITIAGDNINLVLDPSGSVAFTILNLPIVNTGIGNNSVWREEQADGSNDILRITPGS